MLHPIPNELYKKLPTELREKVDELLLDFTDTFAVLRYDKDYAGNSLIFPSTYLLSPTIIGRIICNEVQQLFIPKAPINFCGLLDNISINALLDTRLPSVVLSATWSGICVGLCATKHRQQVPPDQR